MFRITRPVDRCGHAASQAPPHAMLTTTARLRRDLGIQLGVGRQHRVVLSEGNVMTLLRCTLIGRHTYLVHDHRLTKAPALLLLICHAAVGLSTRLFERLIVFPLLNWSLSRTPPRFDERNLLPRSCDGDSVRQTPTHFNPYRFRQTLSTTHRRLIPCKGYLNTHQS